MPRKRSLECRWLDPLGEGGFTLRPASTRPPLVTAAGILLMISGGLSIVLSFLYFRAGGAFFLTGLITIAIGAITIWAGLQVLQLREQGRMLGLVLAGVGAVFALINLIQGATLAIITLAIDAFVIYALVTAAQFFRR